MTDEVRIRELARRSPNFGYLLAYEPLLVQYGAGAEASVFTDPNGALVKCRQFVETLTQELLNSLGKPPQRRLVTNIAALDDAGVLVPRVRSAFDQIRDLGNKATHHHLSDERRALDSVRSCFGLGLWFHRALSDDREARAFVPPQPSNDAEATAAAELRGELEQMRAELAEARTRLAEATSREAAEAQARREAEEIVARAFADRGEAQTLTQELEQGESLPTAPGADQEALFERAPETPEASAEPSKVSATERERIVERAREPEPLNEVQARRLIDRMLAEAGWIVQDFRELNPLAGIGVAVREFPLTGGRADYVLYVDGKIVGVVEAKREGVGLAGAEWQSGRYAAGLPKSYALAAWHADEPLPFRYETTGTRTQFTNMLDPEPRSREVFSFHRPETVQGWMAEASREPRVSTWRTRLRTLPELDTAGLRPAQQEAIHGVERSLARDDPRALVQMATGAGKTYMAVTLSYRLLAYARARRILFLVDRNNLGRQTRGEFANFVTPGDGRKFTELYNVERLAGHEMVDSSHVVISTIQRMYAVLRGGQPLGLDDDDEMYGTDEPGRPVTVDYNSEVPPESFDLVIVDECHRSIYGKWRGVLEYFDAHLVGLTATPVKQTFGFFHQNLVSEYPYEAAVADGVNVDFDVYRIRTDVTERGSDIEAGTVVPKRDRRTRRERYEELEDDYSYTGTQLGRSVIAKHQIRLVLETFRGRLFTEIFPRREAVPKTLIYARDDNHAEDIVRQVRESFGRGNDFAAKITYSAENPDELLQRFRNDPALRIAVTVDMIATGTDVRPLECVFFLRDVKSPAYFEQMKGRGARTVDPTEFQALTPDSAARSKERFVIVDAVGVTDSPIVDATPLQRHPRSELSFEQLLTKASTRNIDVAETSTLASRLARLNQQVTDEERAEVERVGGQPLGDIVGRIVGTVDPDTLESVRASGGEQGVREAVLESVRPLTENPELRQELLRLRRDHDITIDEVTHDTLTEAYGVPREQRAREWVRSWRDYLSEHKDEIAALQVLYGQRDGRSDGRVTWAQLKDLAARIKRGPHAWTPENLWEAYKTLEQTAPRSGQAGVVDLVSLVRYELGLDGELWPYRSVVEERFAAWLRRQEQAGVRFTVHQRWWLERICDVVATSAEVSADYLEDPPFTAHGGVAGFEDVFGSARAAELLDELSKELPA